MKSSIFDINHPVVNAGKRSQGLKLIDSRLLREQSDKVYWVGQEMLHPLPDKSGTPFDKHSETRMVSVAVRTYNRPAFLSSCLESIADQTLKNIEVIVVNDGGPDVATLLDTFNDRLKIVYIRHPSNRGRAAALNSALKASTGKYIAYLDDDDIYYPKHLETLVDELEKGRFKVAYSDTLEVMQSLGNGRYQDIQKRLVYSQDFNRDLLLKTNYIPILNVVHRRDCLESVELFDENLKVLEDWDFWIRMSLKFDFIHVPTVTAEYHVRTDSTNATTSEGTTFPEYRQRVWEKHRHIMEETFRKREVPATSIVILTYNQQKHIKEFVGSIRRYTPEKHEIVFVDNGSTKGTVKCLLELVKENTNCKLIENKTNPGFAKGCNQGIEVSSGEYVLFLNSDVVITKHWLNRLFSHLEKNPAVGMAGPMSNMVSGPQSMKEVPYGKDMLAMQKFARNLAAKNSGKITEVMMLDGFCLLIKKEVLDVIGGLDERESMKGFEIDDLCLRSAIADYRSIIAQDVFIHNNGNAIDGKASRQGNCKHFADKWKDIVAFDNDGYNVHLTKDRQRTMLIEWAEERLSKGDAPGAARIFERVFRLVRTDFEALNNLGVIQWQIGEAGSAINTFQTALAVNPNDPGALANLLQAATEVGRFDLVKLNVLNALKQSQPKNPDVVKLINGYQGQKEIIS